MPGRACCFCGSKKDAAEPELPEKEWTVGGRYRANRAGFALWSASELSGTKVGELGLQDVVLLLNIADKPGSSPRGLVLPPNGRAPGWLALEAGPSKGWPLVRRRVHGSWDIKARYSVKNPATLREGPSITSEEVTEVEPGDEVLVLELGHNNPDQDGGKVRLRALVSTSAGAIGWMSPETASGDHLLEPVNLLSPKVVEIHQKSLSRSSNSLLGGDSPSGPRRSCTGGLVPWEVGGKYRVLEKLVVRERPDLNSRELAKITPGSLVTFSDVQKSLCDSLGMCPVAFVTVDEGPEKGRKGWVRCAATDGRDLIDTRDQLEYEKVLHKMRTSVAAPQGATGIGPSHLQAQMVAAQRASQQHRQDQEQLQGVDEDTETSSKPAASQDKSRTSKSESTKEDDGEHAEELQDEPIADPASPSLPAEPAKVLPPQPRKLVERIEGFQEIGKGDDRMVNDGAILEDKSYLCNCNCGANRPNLPFGSR